MLYFYTVKSKMIKRTNRLVFKIHFVINFLLLIRRWVPRAWITRGLRGSVIGWTILPRRASIIISSYSCHGHAIMVPSLASFRNDNLDKLFHVSSSILQWMFGTERHFGFVICFLLYLISAWQWSGESSFKGSEIRIFDRQLFVVALIR